jgi:hypothetical protein
MTGTAVIAELLRPCVLPGSWAVVVGADRAGWAAALAELVGPDGRVFDVRAAPQDHGRLTFTAHALGSDADDPLHAVTIRGSSLDTLFAEAERPVCAVACDLVGCELECLRGAADLTWRWWPVWLFRTPVTAAERWLAAAGYERRGAGVFVERNRRARAA